MLLERGSCLIAQCFSCGSSYLLFSAGRIRLRRLLATPEHKQCKNRKFRYRANLGDKRAAVERVPERADVIATRCQNRDSEKIFRNGIPGNL